MRADTGAAGGGTPGGRPAGVAIRRPCNAGSRGGRNLPHPVRRRLAHLWHQRRTPRVLSRTAPGRPRGGRSRALRGGQPRRALAGRVLHPLDDKRSFMESSHPPIPIDQQGLVALFSLSPSIMRHSEPLPRWNSNGPAVARAPAQRSRIHFFFTSKARIGRVRFPFGYWVGLAVGINVGRHIATGELSSMPKRS